MRLSVVAIAVSLSLVGLAAAQNVRAAIRKPTDIPAQELERALQALAKDRQFQVIYRSEIVGQRRSGAATGDLTTSEALTQLLDKTGLTYQYLDDHTVTIVPVTAAAQSAAAITLTSSGEQHEEGARGASLWDRFRMAQVDQGTPMGAPSLEKDSAQSHQSLVKLEEVVVTAQKREERLLDVPISIVALSTDELQSRKITSMDDLQFAVPGMAISSDGLTNRIELRGISNSVGVAPLVGVYIDEAAVTNSGAAQINADTYDLERVEVLRGPQGTLYGEGSAGGTIRFITKNPVLDRFGMTASVASTFTQDGSPGERINTALNIPLIDQELGVRIVGTYDREGGWIDQPAAGLKDINGEDITNVRVKTLWKPSPQFSASFMAELYRNDRSTGANDDVAGNFTQVFNLTTTPKVREDHDIYNLTLTYDFTSVKILNTTSYLRENVEARNIGYDYYPGTPRYNLLNPYTVINDHALVEELRLSSIGSGSWQWTVGGFYRHYRDFADAPVGYYDVLGPPGTPLPASYGAFAVDTLFKSWSLFGDVNYRFGERYTLGLGVRSFHETQDYIQVQDYGFGPFEIDQTGKFHSVDPRVYAQYKLSRDVNIYASAAKGFRSGGFNVSPTQPTFSPENVRTYELGTKMSLMEGRIRTETAIFYTDYKDYVAIGKVNVNQLFTAYFNAGNAKLKGIEWNFVWRPSDQWSLGVNGDYLDTRFTKINSTTYDVGDPIDFVPKYQITSSAERDFRWNDKLLSMRLDYTRRGRETHRDRSVGPSSYSETDVINLLGYYMNLRWSEPLSLNLFAQNLLNDRGITVPNTGSFVRSRPRTYGVGFDVYF